MGGKCCEKNRVPTFHRLCFFPALENRVKEMWGLCFFSTAFPPPHVWDSVFFYSLNVHTPLSPTSSCILEPGFRLWLPVMLWHYNLHQTKLFKDFAPKKSNLIINHHINCKSMTNLSIINQSIINQSLINQSWINHQSIINQSSINHQSSIINHESSTNRSSINHQSMINQSIINKSAINYQSFINQQSINHRPIINQL